MELVEVSPPDEWETGLIVKWEPNTRMAIYCGRGNILVNMLSGKWSSPTSKPPNYCTKVTGPIKFYRWKL